MVTQRLRSVSKQFLYWFLAIVVTVALYFISTPVMAAGDGSSLLQPSLTGSTLNQTTGTNPSTGVDPKIEEAFQKECDDASYVSRMIGDPINGMATAVAAAGFVSVDKLVFGFDRESIEVFATAEDGSNEFDAVAPVYWKFMLLAWMLLIIVVMFRGWRIAKGQTNPRVRATIGEIMLDLVIGVFMMCFLWFVVYYFASWNAGLCQWIAPYSATQDSGISSVAVTTGDYLLSSFIRLILIGLSIFINILYVVRKFLLIGFVVLAAFVAVAWAAGNKQPFVIWLSEVMTNALMPFSHAIVFSIYYRLYAWSMTHNAGMMSKWWVPIVVLFLLIPVSALFRRLFSSLLGQFMGMTEETAASGGLMGLTGLAGTASLLGSLAGGAIRDGKQAMLHVAGRTAGNLTGGGNITPNGVQGSPLSTATTASSYVGTGGGNASSTAVQTGVGKVSSLSMSTAAQKQSVSVPSKAKGIHALQEASGSFRQRGASLAGGLGRFTGATTGAALDLGMMAATGGKAQTNFRHALASTGGTLGRAVGSVGGGYVGLGVGTYRSIRQQQQAAGKPMGAGQAFREAMGMQSLTSKSQPNRLRAHVAEARLLGNVVGTALGPNVADRLGEMAATRTMRKGLERLGNLKER